MRSMLGSHAATRKRNSEARLRYFASSSGSSVSGQDRPRHTPVSRLTSCTCSRSPGSTPPGWPGASRAVHRATVFARSSSAPQETRRRSLRPSPFPQKTQVTDSADAVSTASPASAPPQAKQSPALLTTAHISSARTDQNRSAVDIGWRSRQMTPGRTHGASREGDFGT